MGKASPQLYPFESHFMDIGGHRYHYIEEGEGDPVVMLHGNPSWSFYYRELVKRLSPHFHCIVPDHIGMGYSDKPRDRDYSYTFAQRVSDLDQFLTAKGITRNITLVLHDWGGLIGLGFARLHTQSIRRIVILNTAAFHLPQTKRFPISLWLTRTWLGALAVQGFNAFSGGATRVGVKRGRMPRDIRRGYIAPYDSWHNRIATLRFVQDIPLRKSDPGYDAITDIENNLHAYRETPVLIAWGLKDKVFDRHILDRWIEFLPHAKVHRFEDCGHYVLEDAQEEIGQLVEDFLRH